MCGRVTLASTAEQIVEYFQLTDLPSLPPRYNICPTQQVAVIRFDPQAGRRTLTLMQWGLIPSWASDPNIGSRMINARVETAAEKPAFREAFRQRRCLIPTDGFYEWAKLPQGKRPYWIRVRDQPIFALAGLWDCNAKLGGEPILTFTILTTDANELVRPMHDRMPLIVEPNDFELWLDPNVREPDALKTLLRRYPSEKMVAQPVGHWVNDPVNEGPRCIQPADDEPAAPPARAPTVKKRKGEDDKQGMLF
ncbi:MAG TPA: SOS response-associated peptidase [Planctomycetota bacterium]|jgi:putative SOS response-associated peptidase YedK